MKYRVWAAEFTDTDFKTQIPGTKIEFGVHASWKDAMVIWRTETWKRVDNCYYRVWIEEE